jgi:hypothetical protein
MKRLALAALLMGLLVPTTGCFIVTDDDDDDVGDDDDDDDGTGQFELTWTLESGGQEITCEEAGAEAVAVFAAPPVGDAYSDVFDCADGQGITSPLPADDYTVTVQIIESGNICSSETFPVDGAPPCLGESAPRDGTLDPGEIVDLGDFLFDFEPAAAFDVQFSVDFGDAGGANCEGGEGVISQDTVVSLQTDMQCIPLELVGEGDAGVDDTCSGFAACMEPEVVQTLVGLDPGDYRLSVEGLIDDEGGNSVRCYHGDIEFAVTDGEEDLGILLAPFDPKDPKACGAT